MGGKPRAASKIGELIALTEELRDGASRLRFGGKVRYVYNPLDYAWPAHRQYLERFGGRSGVALLLGMNPGPWGMAQTGVPFGEVSVVRDWLAIDGPIGKPDPEHPKRPVTGLNCHRNEVSGARLWGWARDYYKTPDAFFDRFFVWNYCPLSFMVDSGANFIPEKLTADERRGLYAVCDRALRAVVELVEPSQIIGVGKFAENRAKRVLPGGIPIGTVLHPSPASPIANRGWAAQAEKQLSALGAL